VILALAACAPLRDWPVAAELLVATEPRVGVTPASLDFGDVSVNQVGEVELLVSVQNLGTDDVTLTGHDEPIGDEGFVVGAEPFLGIAPGASLDIPVRFVPESEQVSSASLRFEPGSEVVKLSGRGHAPVLVVADDEVPATVVGCSGVATVTLSNEGSETLVVSDASVEGSDYALTGWPADIGPADEGTVELRFTPGGSGDRGAVLTLTTNDPARAAFPVTLEGLGYEGERVTEDFRYVPTQPTDLLFVVEPAATGADARVAPALEAYVESLASANVDFRATALASASPCPDGEPEWADAGDTELSTIRVLERAFEGSGGPWDADLLGLALSALAETGDGECLEGFHRADADLDVVVVAASPPENDLEEQLARLLDAVSDPGTLRLSALVPGSSACGEANSAYADAAQANGGAVGDLCAESWVASFEAFAALPAVEAPVTYALAELPVVTTLVVTADGADFSGWTYDASANALTFATQSAPVIGADMSVSYVSAVDCE
jgi:hypothetical protein